MIDREKVIRGLECCTTGDCEGCPYDGDGDLRGECIRKTQVDALEIINDLIFCRHCGFAFEDEIDLDRLEG